MDDKEHTISGERMTVGGSSARNEADHIARYEYAKQFVLNKRVLDIACGTGFGAAMLSEAGATSVYGVDIDEASISYATKNYGCETVQFVTASAEKIDVPDNQFDVIVSFETIEHLEDDLRSKYLDELFRTLKPDGNLLISTPNKRITSPWQEKPNNPFHVLEYTREMLKKELTDHGFAVKSWGGQRFIKRWKTGFLVRKASRVFEKLTGKQLHWYDLADGEKVRPLTANIEPRYFIVTLNKQKNAT